MRPCPELYGERVVSFAKLISNLTLHQQLVERDSNNQKKYFIFFYYYYLFLSLSEINRK